MYLERAHPAFLTTLVVLVLNSKQLVCNNCDEQFTPVYTASLHTDFAHGAKRKNLIKRYTLMKLIFKIFNLEEH